MTASVTQFPPRPRKADADAADLRALLERRPDLLPDHLAGKVLTSLDQREASTNGWRFLQVSAQANLMVVTWLSEHSRQPIKALRCWAELLANMRADGIVTLSRTELAQAIDVKPAECSRIMTELQKLGAVERKREKVAGIQGQGPVQYRVNARIATGLSGLTRDKAQAEASNVLAFPAST